MKQVAKRSVIGRSKLAYFAAYHARHERVKLCNLRNEKRENVTY